jgi:hypothetical protein
LDRLPQRRRPAAGSRAGRSLANSTRRKSTAPPIIRDEKQPKLARIETARLPHGARFDLAYDATRSVWTGALAI